MIGIMPKFFDSPYCVKELGNVYLKPGAPKEVVEEYEAYKKEREEWQQGFKDALKANNIDKIEEV